MECRHCCFRAEAQVLDARGWTSHCFRSPVYWAPCPSGLSSVSPSPSRVVLLLCPSTAPALGLLGEHATVIAWCPLSSSRSLTQSRARAASPVLCANQDRLCCLLCTGAAAAGSPADEFAVGSPSRRPRLPPSCPPFPVPWIHFQASPMWPHEFPSQNKEGGIRLPSSVCWAPASLPPATQGAVYASAPPLPCCPQPPPPKSLATGLDILARGPDLYTTCTLFRLKQAPGAAQNLPSSSLTHRSVVSLWLSQCWRRHMFLSPQSLSLPCLPVLSACDEHLKTESDCVLQSGPLRGLRHFAWRAKRGSRGTQCGTSRDSCCHEPFPCLPGFCHPHVEMRAQSQGTFLGVMCMASGRVRV